MSIEWTGDRDCSEWPHNTDRADHFAAVLEEGNPDNDDRETALRDLLADAMHFCDATTFDFEEALRMARENYETEVEREKDGAHVCDTRAADPCE